METFRLPPQEEKPKKKQMGKVGKLLGVAGIAAAAGFGIDKALTSESPTRTDENETIEAPEEPGNTSSMLQGAPRANRIADSIEQTKTELVAFHFDAQLKQSDRAVANTIGKEIVQVRSILQTLEYRDELERKGFAEKREQAVNNILQVFKESLEENLANTADSNIRQQSINQWNLLADFVRGRGYTVSVETPKLP